MVVLMQKINFEKISKTKSWPLEIENFSIFFHICNHFWAVLSSLGYIKTVLCPFNTKKPGAKNAK